ncbi:MAG: DUF4258 domain-containing protein [Deltaproteobacteria bacterium]|nr:DUF4258 domain-containing protein [Deltaproteobacteria bacterium]
MTPEAAAALEDIRGLSKAGRVDILPHAWKQMLERGVEVRDVLLVLRTATECAEDKEPGKWLVSGHDLDGDRLRMVVAIEGDVVVVTVF